MIMRRCAYHQQGSLTLQSSRSVCSLGAGLAGVPGAPHCLPRQSTLKELTVWDRSVLGWTPRNTGDPPAGSNNSTRLRSSSLAISDESDQRDIRGHAHSGWRKISRSLFRSFDGPLLPRFASLYSTTALSSELRNRTVRRQRKKVIGKSEGVVVSDTHG